MKVPVIFWVAVCCLPTTTFAQALVDRVPADAFVYVGWKGSDALGPAYDKSKLKKFVDSSSIPALLNDTVPQLLVKAAGQGPEEHVEEVNRAWHLTKYLAKHPTAFYVSGFDVVAGEDSPKPHFGLICQAGADSKALLAILTKLAADGKDEDMPLRVIEDGDVVALVGGYGEKETPLAGAGSTVKSLGALPAYLAAKDHLTADPAVVVYGNVDIILAKIDAGLKAQNDEETYARWTRGRDASGIAGLKQFVYSAGFAGEDWESQTFIDAPSPRTGLLKLLEPSPIDAALLARIPGDATSATFGQFDLAAVVATARDIVTAIDPAAGQQFQKGLGFLSISLGRRIEAEILEPLGSQWAVFTAPSVGDRGTQGTIIVNRLDDPKLAKAAWGDLAIAASNTLPGLLGRQGIVLTPNFDDKAVPGATLFSMGIANKDWSPAWVVTDQFLYIGFDAAILAKAANAGEQPKIETNGKFAALMKQLDAPTYTSFAFGDLVTSAPLVSKNIETAWTQVMDLAGQQGVDLPPELLPPVEKILPLLSPAGSVGWADSKGLYAKEHLPFPGAGLLYGYSQESQQTLTVVGASALGVSILLPSLNHARETANRVKSAANLKQIGNGSVLYSNENKGKMPPDLGQLLIDEGLTVQVFICPSGNTTIPAEVLSGTPEEQAAWVNAHGDYVYIKPTGVIGNLAADTPVAYEKLGLHGKDGINILYGDGHADWVSLKVATDSIKQASGAEPVKYEKKKPTTQP